MSLPRIRSLRVSTTQGLAGTLTKDARHVFNYDPGLIAAGEAPRAISLIMPVRAESWARTPMLPAFQTFLPEGFLRTRIVERFGKTMRIDDMALLAMSGSNAIGRIRVTASGSDPLPGQVQSAPESLRDILGDQGNGDLFEYLCDKYLIASGIAGVQPKAVVPATDDRPARKQAKSSLGRRSTLRARQFIVKAEGPEFPGIAENEFHCLSIARSLSDIVPVPGFDLSADRRRLAIERFDIDDNSGNYLGFEDMVAVFGRVNEEKYQGSYEKIAEAVTLFAAPPRVAESLRRLYATVVLAVVLRNGDAHLKNFGLLYTHPSSNDACLSPLYDLVCTRAHIEKDLLALSLAKTRAWPVRRTLVAFGRNTCGVRDAEVIIEKAIDAALAYRPADPGPIWAPLRRQIEAAASSLKR